MPYTMHVISHTHWDREWYLTFQQFRLRLVDLIDHLLEILDTDPDFKHFNFDGQTIVLEDYLQIRPQNERKLRKYIEQGRILVGPWYQLNDEYLVSGESTIRSLLIGHRLSEKFGTPMKVGYIPDQFGNISQMPQIFRGFGIDNAIFGRGVQLVGDRKMEFCWESPDGSRVLASLMAYWYNNAQWFPSDTDKAVEYVEAIRDRMAPGVATPELLLMNGVDHLEAQAGLPDILRRANKRLQGDRLVHSTLPAYVEAVKQDMEREKTELKVFRGELREDRGGSCLAGTLSSRMYLKQANHATENWLEKYAEPSSVFAWTLGRDYPSDFLNYAWKLLMQNHPHDSICGCSLDQVHDEMVPRFQQVQQLAEEFTTRSLSHIAGMIETAGPSTENPSPAPYALVVFNPLNWERTDRVRTTIDIPVSDPVRDRPAVDPARDIHAIELRDADGKVIPYHLLEQSLAAKQVLSPIELPLAMMVRRFEIEFVAENVPSCGYKTFSIRPVDAQPDFSGLASDLAIGDGFVSNGIVEMRAVGGGITVRSFASPQSGEFVQVGVLEDGGDVGDEYLYRRPANDTVVSTAGTSPRVTVLASDPVSATIRIEGVMSLPASATPDGSARSGETVDCPYTSDFTITAGSPRVDCVTEFENRAKDHRLRVLFPSGISTDVSHAEGQFDILTRPVRPPEDWVNAAPYYPQRTWVNVTDGDRGLTIISNGLPEYEVYDDPERTIAITLQRSVGRLSGGSDAPGAKLTPGAQWLGAHRFEYAILPHAGDWRVAKVWQQANQHDVPMACAQTGAHGGDLPMEMSFLRVTPPELIVTAIKKAEDRDTVIVRFFNILDKKVHNAEISMEGTNSARTTNLNEEPGRELLMDANGTVKLDLPAKKIATIEFTLEGAQE